MSLFEKKVEIYSSKGKKEEWKNFRRALKAAGIWHQASSYEDEMPVGGCGAQMDVRDYGPNGRIDRCVYSVRVRKSDLNAAGEVLKKEIPAYAPYMREK